MRALNGPRTVEVAQSPREGNDPMTGDRSQPEDDDLDQRLPKILRAAINAGQLEYAEAYGIVVTVLGSYAAEDFGPDPAAGLRGVG